MSPSRTTLNTPSILDGVDEVIDSALRLTATRGSTPKYGQKTIYRKQKVPSANVDASHLVAEIYKKVACNWAKSKKEERRRSRMNWCFRKQRRIDDRNDSDETRLERDIVRIPKSDRFDSSNWGNQVPVASGLVHPHADRRRCIDLVHWCSGENSCEFIELKTAVDSGTPLFAAMEILKYGVVYLFCRIDRDVSEWLDLNQKLLNASHVGLRVLAPADYYVGYDLLALSQLAKRISKAFPEYNDSCGRRFGVDISFQTLTKHCDGASLISISRAPIG